MPSSAFWMEITVTFCYLAKEDKRCVLLYCTTNLTITYNNYCNTSITGMHLCDFNIIYGIRELVKDWTDRLSITVMCLCILSTSLSYGLQPQLSSSTHTPLTWTFNILCNVQPIILWMNIYILCITDYHNYFTRLRCREPRRRGETFNTI